MIIRLTKKKDKIRTKLTEMVIKLVSLMERGAWLMLCLCFAQGQRLAPKFCLTK